MTNFLNSLLGIKDVCVNEIIYDAKVQIKYSHPPNIKYSDIIQNEALNAIKDILSNGINFDKKIHISIINSPEDVDNIIGIEELHSKGFARTLEEINAANAYLYIPPEHLEDEIDAHYLFFNNAQLKKLNTDIIPGIVIHETYHLEQVLNGTFKNTTNAIETGVDSKVEDGFLSSFLKKELGNLYGALAYDIVDLFADNRAISSGYGSKILLRDIYGINKKLKSAKKSNISNMTAFTNLLNVKDIFIQPLLYEQKMKDTGNKKLMAKYQKRIKELKEFMNPIFTEPYILSKIEEFVPKTNSSLVSEQTLLNYLEFFHLIEKDFVKL